MEKKHDAIASPMLDKLWVTSRRRSKCTDFFFRLTFRGTSSVLTGENGRDVYLATATCIQLAKFCVI